VNQRIARFLGGFPMRLTLCLITLAALALSVPPAPACDVPAQAFAPGYGCGVPAQAPVFVQRAPVFVQRAPVVRQRAFVPAYSGAAFAAPAGGLNVNVNSGNVGRARLLRR
jgi:hypothetical protein